MMIQIDPTLHKLREMESDHGRLLLEIAQSMEEFKQQVRADFEQQGIKASDRFVEYFIEVYGLDAPRTPEAAERVKQLMKHPNEFIANLQKLSGDDAQKMAQKISAKGNPSQDPQITQGIENAIKLLQQIEGNTSMTRSVAEMQSGDQYAQIQYLGRILNQLTGQTQQQAQFNMEIMKWMKNAANAVEKGAHPLYGIDQTGKGVTVMTEVKEGTVIIDSDNKRLDQNALNIVVQTLQQRGIQFTAPVMTGATLSPPHHAWVLIMETKEVVDVDKALLAPAHFKPVMSSVVQTNPTAAKIIASITSETERKVMAKLFGGLRSTTKAADKASEAMGYDPDKYREIMGVKNLGYDFSGKEITMQITSGAYNRPAFKLLSFVGENSDTVQITEKYVLLNGKIENNVFRGDKLEMKFTKLPPKLDYIKSMTITSDEKTLTTYIRAHGINAIPKNLGGNKFEIILQ